MPLFCGKLLGHWQQSKASYGPGSFRSHHILLRDLRGQLFLRRTAEKGSARQASGTAVSAASPPARISNEIVTRESLRERLWPANTFVEFDASLSVAVGKLRQALGDEAENPR